MFLKNFIKVSVLVFLLLFSCALSLFLIEKLLQFKHYQTTQIWWNAVGDQKGQKFILHSDRIWSLRPNTHLEESFGNDASVKKSHTTDENGFRLNSENKNLFSFPYTIMVVGDSYTYGHGVNDNETVTAFLQQKLKESGIQVNVINAGVQGYNPPQEYLYLKKEIIPRFKPQLIIWNISVNDLEDMKDKSLFFFSDHHLIALPAWLQGIYIEGLLQKTIGRFFNHSLAYNLLLSTLDHFGPIIIFHHPTYEENFRKIRVMVQDISKQHPNMLVTYIPAQWYFVDNFAMDLKSDLERQKVMLDSLSQNSSYFLDGNEAITVLEKQKDKDVVVDPSLFLDETGDLHTRYGYKHLSVHGNEQFAVILHDYILAHHLIQQ
jgi:lysophospholipase L1-like esterase